MQEAHTAYNYEVCPNEYASHELVLTWINEFLPRATPPMAMSSQGLNHSTWMSVASSVTTGNITRPVDMAVDYVSIDSCVNSADGLWKIQDDLVYLQKTFALLNKPFSVDEHDITAEG